jgi:SUMO ligase MMS21 Smc5/6 complex component
MFSIGIDPLVKDAHNFLLIKQKTETLQYWPLCAQLGIDPLVKDAHNLLLIKQKTETLQYWPLCAQSASILWLKMPTISS